MLERHSHNVNIHRKYYWFTLIALVLHTEIPGSVTIASLHLKQSTWKTKLFAYDLDGSEEPSSDWRWLWWLFKLLCTVANIWPRVVVFHFDSSRVGCTSSKKLDLEWILITREKSECSEITTTGFGNYGKFKRAKGHKKHHCCTDPTDKEMASLDFLFYEQCELWEVRIENKISKPGSE